VKELSFILARLLQSICPQKEKSMKKAALVIALLTLLLAACSPGASPTLTDAEMATRVASILTGMPTNSPVATQVPSNTPETPQPTPQVVHDTPQASNTPLIATIVSTETNVVSTKAAAKAPTATRTPGTPGTPTITRTPSDTLQPSLTPPNVDPVSTLGNPTGTDPMDNPDKWTWPVGKDDFTSNGFDDGHMWLTGESFKPGWIVSAIHTDDAYIQETVKTEGCSGSDNYGIIFRVPVLRTADRGYLFGLTCDGRYSIWAWDGRVGPKGTRTVLIDWKASKYIHAGSNQTNRIGVMAQDTKLTLYVNGARVDQITNSTYSEGYLGVFINPDSTTRFTVDVTEMKYWNTAP
jgi:hypothetical protein